MNHPRHSLVVVPTYDEAENITELLDRVLAAAPQSEVLVVDDDSPDGTAGVVLRHPQHGTRVHLLVRPGKAGLGAAYRAGFRWAIDRGYDRVVQMDADLSHPPESVPALLAALDTHDVAVGSRYVRGGAVDNWSLSRRLISRAGNVYVGVVLGLPVKDATAGFKAFRSSALAEIGVTTSESNGYCFQIENTWRAELSGLSVTEVPITFTDRTRGQSKMSGDIVREALLRVVVWRWRERVRHGVFTSSSPGSPSRSSRRTGRHATVDT
jgi:dolichol-phosphate mannosyltransferase